VPIFDSISLVFHRALLPTCDAVRSHQRKKGVKNLARPCTATLPDRPQALPLAMPSMCVLLLLGALAACLQGLFGAGFERLAARVFVWDGERKLEGLSDNSVQRTKHCGLIVLRHSAALSALLAGHGATERCPDPCLRGRGRRALLFLFSFPLCLSRPLTTGGLVDGIVFLEPDRCHSVPLRPSHSHVKLSLFVQQ
jgi:hypothetical protein